MGNSAPYAGQTIRSSDAFGLVTFTPSWSNLTLGTGAVNEGWYQPIGRMVLWGFRLEFGTSPGLPGGSVLCALPSGFAAYTGGGLSLKATLGSWTYRTSSSVHYSGSLGAFEAAGLNAAFAGAWTGTAPNGQIGSTNLPAAPVVQGVLSGSGVYLST